MEALNFLATNGWVYDLVILFFVLLSLLAGVMRGVWRSLFHTLVVVVLLILSYFVIAPLVSNWILDDMMMKYNWTVSIKLGENMELSLNSVRDVFIKIGTLPNIQNPASIVEASNFAYTFVLSAVMFVLTVVIYILGWGISTLLYLFIVPFQSKKKKRLKAEGKKFKKHRLLGMAVSVVPMMILLFVFLNSWYAFGQTTLNVFTDITGMEALQELLGDIDLSMFANIIRIAAPLHGGEGGMFLTPLAFGGNMFTMPYDFKDGFGTVRASVTEVGSDFFNRIFSGIEDLLSQLGNLNGGGGEGGGNEEIIEAFRQFA